MNNQADNITVHAADHGTLCLLSTGEAMRPATKEERSESDASLASGEATGAIEVDGQICFVQP